MLISLFESCPTLLLYTYVSILPFTHLILYDIIVYIIYHIMKRNAMKENEWNVKR